MTTLDKAEELGKFGYWELDIESGKLFWSKQVFVIFKLDPSTYTPSYESFLNSIHPEDREKVTIAYSNSLKNKTPYEIEHRLLFADKSIGYVLEKGETFYDENGNAITTIGTVQDVTSRVIYEQKIKESEEKFRAISNQTTEGITVADLEGNYVFVNPAFCKMSGYSEKELLTMTVFDMKAKGQDHSTFKKSKTEMEGQPIRVILQKKDGTEYITEIIGDVIAVDNKQLVLGTIRDITDREKAENALMELNENLENLVIERTEKLNKTVIELQNEIEQRILAEEKIKESLVLKEVLLREITHRVKNSLQIISSLVNLQKSTVENTQTIDLLSQVAHRIQSLALIHETLYKSNEYELVKFRDYTASLISYITKTFESPNIEFVTDIDDVILSLDTATNCGMIIMELITNSIKYAFPNHKKGIITISLKAANNQGTLCVSDNGIGYPPDTDFRSTKTLGMQLVTSLAQQMEGVIELQRVNGTCFEICFPIRVK